MTLPVLHPKLRKERQGKVPRKDHSSSKTSTISEMHNLPHAEPFLFYFPLGVTGFCVVLAHMSRIVCRGLC